MAQLQKVMEEGAVWVVDEVVTRLSSGQKQVEVGEGAGHLMEDVSCVSE